MVCVRLNTLVNVHNTQLNARQSSDIFASVLYSLVIYSHFILIKIKISLCTWNLNVSDYHIPLCDTAREASMIERWVGHVELPDEGLVKDRTYPTYHAGNGLEFLFNSLLFKVFFCPISLYIRSGGRKKRWGGLHSCDGGVPGPWASVSLALGFSSCFTKAYSP